MFLNTVVYFRETEHFELKEQDFTTVKYVSLVCLEYCKMVSSIKHDLHVKASTITSSHQAF